MRGRENIRGNEMSEQVLKRWRPGVVEVDSYLVVYEKNDTKMGMYVMARDESDARQQVLSRKSEVKVKEVELQAPTSEHKLMMRMGRKK